ncbi:MAG: PIG-L family deacetylase [Anaerolineae bacterium]|nr:PIG-L family deacetylase [Anaerolineae bacterium]
MRILYIFSHPDDESFGPARVMSRQRRQGHEVYLLTLTRGGATRQRHKYGYSIAEMGEVRSQEMLDVARVLDLTGMTVLDLPDSGLDGMDPREIEAVVAEHIEQIQPQVVVTDAVHGISGFFDHLVCHAVVKRAYVELRERVDYLKRLAFWTIRAEETAGASELFHLTGSKAEDIDVVMIVDEVDVEKQRQALDCYVTYRETIEKAGARRNIPREAVFEIYQEAHDPPLKSLVEDLNRIE